MKTLELTVPLEKLESVKESLYKKGVEDITVSGIINQPQYNKRHSKNNRVLLNMFRIEVLVDDNMIEKIKYSLRKMVQINIQVKM